MDFEEWFTENQAKLYGKPRKQAILMAWEHQRTEIAKCDRELVEITTDLNRQIRELQGRLDNVASDGY